MSQTYAQMIPETQLHKSLARLLPKEIKRFLRLKVRVTEKIHGENFRIGITENGIRFIGNRSKTFNHMPGFPEIFINPDLSSKHHPNWHKISEYGKRQITDIHDFLTEMQKDGFPNKPVITYGELYGPGLQKGYDWDFTGLRITLFDIAFGEPPYYLNNPFIFEPFKDYGVPILHEQITMKDALLIDVESIESKLSTSKHIEGIVITPIHGTPDYWDSPIYPRLFLKQRTEKGRESSSKPKIKRPHQPESEFVKYINTTRIEHVISHIEQDTPGRIQYETKDLSFLITEVIEDIRKEGNTLCKNDTRQMTKAIAKIYKEFLKQKALDLIEG